MPELLLEVGTEELPASAIRRAFTELGSRLASALVEADLVAGDPTPVVYGTPRRLIVSFAEVAGRQPDSDKEQRGPGVKAAYDSNGNPTQALLGFCRSQGVDPTTVRTEGDYVWITKQIVGRGAVELLSEILPKAIRALTFDKTMRWGTGRLRFARPIRWLLAAYGGRLVPFEIEGVASGIGSFGHRFYANEAFEAASLSALLDGLRARKVEPDPSVRRKSIVSQANRVAAGKPDLPDSLVEENTFLTEWPNAIEGSFNPDYLELPPPVLVTAMAKHEKMFPVRDEAGKLTDRFVFIRNAGVDDSVRRGCEWVLNARFNDARFFFEEDRKYRLEDFLEKTNGILFQEKLGTIRQRCDRLAKLAPLIAASSVDPGEMDNAAQAGRLSKADLATGLVSELASLQGIVGGEYARREGLPDPVCWALSTQYDLAKNPKPDSIRSRTAVRLVVADQLDKLAGHLGIGLAPSGSSDPFALRRAASLLIEAAFGWPQRLPGYDELFRQSLGLYSEQGVTLDEASAVGALYDLFATRYSTLMPGVRYDLLQAAIIDPSGPATVNPQGVRFRVRILGALANDVAFIQTATRPMNIVTAARRKDIEFGEDHPLERLEHSALESASGLELLEIMASQKIDLQTAEKEERDQDVLRLLKGLQSPINRFFDETMVMADEPEVRYARLTLMHMASIQLLTAGDFSKVVVE